MSDIEHMPDYVKETLKNYGEQKLVVCPSCEGTGVIWTYNRDDYDSALCRTCMGDKMVVKATWNPEFIMRKSNDVVREKFRNDDNELENLLVREAKILLKE